MLKTVISEIVLPSLLIRLYTKWKWGLPLSKRWTWRNLVS